MKYMRINGYNISHIFTLLSMGVNIRKGQLIENCIYQTVDFKEWQYRRLKASEAAFEKVFYKADGSIEY